MKVLMVIIFLSLPSFSSSQIGILKYEDVDHAESVNAAIDRTGVILNLSAEQPRSMVLVRKQLLRLMIGHPQIHTRLLFPG